MKGSRDARLMWLGIVLLVVGFFGHVFAARAIGGTYIAWRDHMVGFVGITLVSAAIAAALGSRFWKGRTDVTVLIVGVIGFALGLMVFMNPPQ